ncbi:MAG: tRNA (cytidine(56)-2'-O)-methyltransferase [Candidatus Norongarragalinales archaeon]
MKRVIILRLGHRKKRDVRVTTHCALVARAFGASEIILSGERDETPLETIRAVTKKWGGKFKARFEVDWRRALKKFRGERVHLTMYGEPLQEKITDLRRAAKKKNVLVVVGAEKVPCEVYALCDYNVAVGNQPHSEVAAIAVFLHELFEGKELNKKFAGALVQIKPNARGKTVLKKKNCGKQRFHY